MVSPSLAVLAPVLECIDYCQKFFVMDFIVDFLRWNFLE